MRGGKKFPTRGKRTNKRTQIEMALCLIMQTWDSSDLAAIDLSCKASHLADDKSRMVLGSQSGCPVLVINSSPELIPFNNKRTGTKLQYANHIKYLAERIKADVGKKAIPLRPRELSFVRASVIYGLEMLIAQHKAFAELAAERLRQIGWSKYQAGKLLAFATLVHKDDLEFWQAAPGENVTAKYAAKYRHIFTLAQHPFGGIKGDGFRQFICEFVMERHGKVMESAA